MAKQMSLNHWARYWTVEQINTSLNFNQKTTKRGKRLESKLQSFVSWHYMIMIWEQLTNREKKMLHIAYGKSIFS